VPLIILAGASCVAGFFKAPLEHYLEIHFEASFTGVLFASLTSAVILGIAIPTAYFLYYKKREVSFISGTLGNSPLYAAISNGYYFDAVYNKVLSGVLGLGEIMHRTVEYSGILRFPYLVAGVASRISNSTYNYLEAFLDRLVYVIAGGAMMTAHQTHVHLDAFLDRFCYILAGGTVETANVTHEYIDSFLDKLVYLFAGKTVESGRKIMKTHRGPLPDFVLAALLGFLLIMFLLIITGMR
jgi:hypothetical protein